MAADGDADSTRRFWKTFLAGCKTTTFPTQRPSSRTLSGREPGSRRYCDVERYHVVRQESHSASCFNEDDNNNNSENAVLLCASWAALCRSYTGSTDVCFVVIITDEDDGKYHAVMPFRIQIEEVWTVTEFLERVHLTLSRCRQHSSGMGLDAIAALDEDCARACMAPSWLCITRSRECLSSALEKSVDGAVQILVGRTRGEFEAHLDPCVVGKQMTTRMLTMLDELVDRLSSFGGNADHTVLDVLRVPSSPDLAQLWMTNQELARPPEEALHVLVAQSAALRPEKIAVDAWDGCVTYKELDERSTRLAQQIQLVAPEEGSVVALSMGRSMSLVIGMLAVMKAGCTFVPLDTAWPSARRERVLELTKASVVVVADEKLASDTYGDDSLSAPTTLCLPGCIEAVASPSSSRYPALPSVDPASAAYILFTSGSTTDPKGVVIEHRSICVTLEANNAVLGTGEHTRMLQFASPTFDMSIVEIMGTLLSGGCLFIPSDNDRMTRLSEYMMEMQINHAALTPTFARQFGPQDVPSLRSLVLGGEPVLATDVTRWFSIPKLFNGFGPTECAVCCALRRIESSEVEAPRIGRLPGVPLWVVDPENHEMLLPTGAVGELLVEGCTLARGYLGDPASTARAFIDDPTWLTRKYEADFPGRSGRLYKTGDLVQYDEDGVLMYVSRKADDSQVKIHGQRLDTGHVEAHLVDCLPMATEVIVELCHRDSAEPNSSVLVALLRLPSNCDPCGTMLKNHDQDSGMHAFAGAATVREQLANRLPAYAIPSIFVCTAEIPRTASDKTDRRRARRMISEFFASAANDRASADGARRLPTTAGGHALQEVWAKILRIPATSIGVDDNFLRLGGDSMAAIQVVIQMRQRMSARLSVAQILQAPTLEALATLTHNTDDDQIASYSPFALLGDDVDHIARVRRDVAAPCRLESSASVLDVYPCTPLQEGLLSLSSRHTGTYTVQKVLRLHPHIALDAFKHAWEIVVDATTILQTRIAHHAELGFVQVVSASPVAWEDFHAADLETFLSRDRKIPLTLDQPLMRCAMGHADADRGETGEHDRFFVLTMHHALYDAWSMPLIMERLSEVYGGKTITRAEFAPFVRWSRSSTDDDATTEHWECRFRDLDESALFPVVPLTISEPLEDSCIDHKWLLQGRHPSGVTRANLLVAAWAIVASHYSGTNDVLFGRTVSGRSASVAGIERIVGPTIATVPTRVRYRPEDTVDDFLQRVQTDCVLDIPYEQTGLQKIGKISPQMRKIRMIRTFLVVQGALYGQEDECPELGTWLNGPGHWRFDASALTLEVFLESGGVVCKAYFDSRVVTRHVVGRILTQLSHVSQQLLVATRNTIVNDIRVLTEADLEQIRSWNDLEVSVVSSGHAPLPHYDVRMQAEAQPEAPAIYAWDANFCYSEMWVASTCLAQQLTQLNLGSGAIIALLLPPSAWVPVSMLAVLRVGACFVPISTDLPDARLKDMLEVLRPSAYITHASIVVSDVFCDGAGEQILVPMPTNKDLSAEYAASLEEASDSSATAWMLFTSGSTGSPKLAMMSHGSVYNSFRSLGEAFALGTDTRMLQFASPAFDACVFEIICTLMHGGVVCVPEAHAQHSVLDLPGACEKMRVNTAVLTPTIARRLRSRDFPSLKALILTGEMLLPSDVEKWEHLSRLYNAYGPAECANMCAVRRVYPGAKDPNCIGNLAGVANWVMHPQSLSHLCPIGGIGELVVGGPTVGSGYFRDRERTAIAFIAAGETGLSPQPQAPLGSQRLYRTGDLVRLGEDGTLSYIGRKDQQVKINGQRVELGEVEHHVLRYAGVSEAVVESVQGATVREVALVAFVTGLEEEAAAEDAGRGEEEEAAPLLVESEGLMDHLLTTLPRYMVPSFVIRMPSLPRMRSGKADRASLRATAERLLAQMAAAPDRRTSRSPKREPTTWAERVLQKAWAQALGMGDAGAADIAATDHFIQRGGSSIEALKVVSLCRKAGLVLSVADMLRSPRLEDQARRASFVSLAPTAGQHQPLDMFPPTLDRQALLSDVAASCGVASADLIEDVYPCSPLQQGLMALAAQGRAPGAYLLRHTFRLPDSIDLLRLKRAWEEVQHTTHVLRTRIVQHPAAGLAQAVVREDLAWLEAGVEEEVEEHEQGRSMGLGQRLTRLALLRPVLSSDCWVLVWTIHHAVADGWTLELVLDKVRRAYASPGDPQTHAFSPFIRYLQQRSQQDSADSARYWCSALAEPRWDVFPRPPPAAPGVAVEDAEECVATCVSLSTHESLATLVRAAWALVQDAHSGGRGDVIFAEGRSGRSAAVPDPVVAAPADDFSSIIGPTLTTVPFRVRWAAAWTLGRLLESVHQTNLAMLAHEHVGLRAISRMSDDCEAACAAAQMLLVIQPPNRAGVTLLHEAPCYKVVGYALSVEVTPEPAAIHAAAAAAATTTARLQLRARFDSRYIDASHVRRLLRQFAYLTTQLSTLPRTAPVGHLQLLPPSELQQIWAWTAYDGETNQEPVALLHDAVYTTALRHADSPAVHAWDGEWTYMRLTGLAHALCQRLRSIGVGATQRFVPLYMEKSRWYVVALLAVLEAGAAAVPLDPAHPSARTALCLSSLCTLYPHEDRIAMVSPTLAHRWSEFRQWTAFELGAGLTDELTTAPSPPSFPRSSLSSPSSPALVLHTSGSTGVPKGVILEHGAVTRSLRLLSTTLGLDASTRMLQFASHSFDLSVWEIFTPLFTGGCTVIPSESQRLHALPAFCAEFRPNTTNQIPSHLRAYRPEDFPTLRCLVLGGEAVSPRDLETWRNVPALYTGYGPTECSFMCGVFSVPRSLDPAGVSSAYARRIGRLPGVPLWVCHPDDPHRLAPIGAVGELVVEGATVARGYMGGDHPSRVAFLEDPPWLLQGDGCHCRGRRGRIYRTGDLVVANDQGELLFVGRKDSQVKIRGQRAELSDIEHNILRALPEVVSAAVAIDPERRWPMHAFVQPRTARAADPQPHLSPYDITAHAEKELRNLIPDFMIPAVWVSVSKLPLTPNGKTDRALLQEWAQMFHRDQLESRAVRAEQVPSSPLEVALHKCYTEILHLDDRAVNLESNFFGIGGDSVSALELIAALRRADIELTITDIYSSPVLKDLARVLKSRGPSTPLSVNEIHVSPFSLLPAAITPQTVVRELASLCHVPDSSIEDVYPCTPMQEGMMAARGRHIDAYMSRYIVELGSGLDADRFGAAWRQVLVDMPILRTHIVNHPTAGFLQVVVEANAYLSAAHTHANTETLRSSKTEGALCQWSWAPASHSAETIFVLRLHHALYDPHVLRLVFEQLNERCTGRIPTPVGDYRLFIRHMLTLRSAAADQFWRRNLAGADAAIFPALPYSLLEINEDCKVTHTFPLASVPRKATDANALRAAWAVVVSWHTRTEEVIFGDVRSGRTADLPHIERIPGPTIAIVPLRIFAKRSMLVDELVQSVQEQVSSTGKHEQVGLHHIQRLSRSCDRACRFQTIINIRRELQTTSTVEDLRVTRGYRVRLDDQDFSVKSRALMLDCLIEPAKDVVHVEAVFDSKTISRGGVEKLLEQFGSVVAQLADGHVGNPKRLDQIVTVSGVDWQWMSHNLNGDTRRRWLVLPDDWSRLAPVGAVGELLSEKKQDASFLEVRAPESLQGPSGSRPSRLWTNGELARHEPGRGLVHVGWKTDMLWFKGHHLNARELESVFSEFTTPGAKVIVDLIVPPRTDDDDVESQLAVFIQPPEIIEPHNEDGEPSVTLSRSSAALDRRLSRLISSRLLPIRYLNVDFIPITKSGVTDRLRLRDVGSRAVAAAPTPSSPAMRSRLELHNEMETAMAQVWADVLKLDVKAIGRDDHFFVLGGNSMTAIALVSNAQARGIVCNVNDVIRNPILEDLAAAAVKANVREQNGMPLPASLLFPTREGSQDVQREMFLQSRTLQDIASARGEVSDVLPCTYMQKEAIRQGGLRYHLQLTFGAADLNTLALRRAVHGLISRHSILRTSFVHLIQHGLLQVVHRTSPAEHFTEVQISRDQSIAKRAADIIHEEKATAQVLQDQRPRFVLLSRSIPGTTEYRLLILGLSHAQADGFSVPIIVRDLAALYQSYHDPERSPAIPASPLPSQFSDVLYGRSRIPVAKLRMHWARLLHGAATMPLSLVEEVHGEATCEHSSATRCHDQVSINITRSTWQKCCNYTPQLHTPSGAQTTFMITSEDVLNCAWAISLACAYSSSDVVFGHVVSGRRVLPGSVASGESLVGSVSNILPVRVTLSGPNQQSGPDLVKRRTLRAILTAVATQSSRSAAFEHTDLSTIVEKFAPPGLWSEIPSVGNSSKSWRWGSVVAWQDFSMMQAVDSCRSAYGKPLDSLASVSQDVTTQGYMSPYAAASEVEFAGMPCTITCDIPDQDFANVVVIARPLDDYNIRIALRYVRSSLDAKHAQRLAATVAAVVDIMSLELDIEVGEVLTRVAKRFAIKY